jgi:hypothetical protein
MDAWLHLIRLGDLGFTLPAAAGMTAWLLAARAWRMAFWWSLLFAAAIGLVGASKIAFLGWGGGWQALCFKALSGHAAGATAVLPLLAYLLLLRAAARTRALGIATALALGALLAALLVASGEHSWSEALAGWCFGAAASLGAIHFPGTPAPLRAPGTMLAFALVFALGAWVMQWVHIEHWMVLAARQLSGNAHTFNLSLH